jgi:hypothetical protein
MAMAWQVGPLKENRRPMCLSRTPGQAHAVWRDRPPFPPLLRIQSGIEVIILLCRCSSRGGHRLSHKDRREVGDSRGGPLPPTLRTVGSLGTGWVTVASNSGRRVASCAANRD